MKQRLKSERKAYGMMRMVKALGRAIKSASPIEKDRAARWAAAWGVISGIRTRGIRLRRSVLFDQQGERRRPRTG